MKKLLMMLSLSVLLLPVFNFVFAQERNNTAANETKSSFRDISVRELKNMIDAREDFVLLDVHVPEQKHLNKTDAFIPFDAIGENADKLPADKLKKLVVFCRSGSMSAKASAELIRLGYADVYNVEGGMNGWKNAGYPVDGPDRIIYLKARKFSFSPDSLRVKQGEKVRIITESIDVLHGFSLEKFNIEEAIEPGRQKRIDFIANEKGVFVFRCFVYCGQGHSNMQGKLLVE